MVRVRPFPYPGERNGDARPTRIGALLVARGALSASRLAQALETQIANGGRLGEILVRHGWADARAVAQAAADQAGVPLIDLDVAPIDPDLADPRDLETYLTHGVAPWRRLGGKLIFVATDALAAAEAFTRLSDPPDETSIALAEPSAFERAVAQAYGPALARRAASRAPEALSARAPTPVMQKIGLIAIPLLVACGLALAPAQVGPLMLALLVTLNAMNAVLRIAVLGFSLREPTDPHPAPSCAAEALADRRGRLRVTLLIPLRHEPQTMPVLLEALEKLDWPHDLLDVKLILEADDDETREALEHLHPPPFASILIAPPGLPRTKPRALNYALDFAKGDIIGVYDAEDRPEPDQLKRVAAILRDSGPDVACVQCRLAYYNPRENWLTRCFTLEYAMWFDVLLRGFRHLRLPIPLGGTSVFFRRSALRSLGGWDAQNVTEDADLGMRLARSGFRCEVSVSTTYEEANSRLNSWVRQRSRWLKGYMQTWLVHMRRPALLLRELGLNGFLGFQAIFLGAMVAYFGLPLFWTLWALALMEMGPQWLNDAPPWAMAGVAIVQLAGWLAMLTAALIATSRRKMTWLQPWIPTLVFYWPIGAVAAYLALVEMFIAPALWRKTQHGVGREAARLRVAALAQRQGGTGRAAARVRAAE